MTKSKQVVAEPVLVEPPGAIASPKLDGAGLRIGLVSTRHCGSVVDSLTTACRGELLLKGVVRSDLEELRVLLPYDLPYATKCLLERTAGTLDAVVVIGCLVREQSVAFEFVAEAVTRACLKLGLKYKTPVIYGVLACASAAQAKHCAGLHETSKMRSCSFGVEWAQSAIEMARLNRQAAQRMVDACSCSCHSPAGHADDRPSEGERESEARRREGGFLVTKGTTVTGTIPAAAAGHHGSQAATGAI
ncbi:hypothetical protein P43SY_000956 [Pythium insidiosum]|uniref:6,7-dimethyl-8-ribityllumazine synthase n=1 Tax=Pythium insidiosum TaxID=114742 RepID=A0AAD5LW68_PYTIN|nr:hypothetical protein P43SY_000956 [Pythium insidiosum]